MLGLTSVLTPVTVNTGALSRGCRKTGRTEDCMSADPGRATAREKRFLCRGQDPSLLARGLLQKQVLSAAPPTSSSLSPPPRPPAPLTLELEQTRQSARGEAARGPVTVCSAVFVLRPALQAPPRPCAHRQTGPGAR